MIRAERVRYEMFLRLVDFWALYKNRFPESSKGGLLFEQIARAAQQVEAQDKARLQARHDGTKGKAELRQAVLKWMRGIAMAARDAAQNGAGSRAQLRMPGQASGVTLLTNARLFQDVAKPFGAELVARGLPVDWEAQFKTAIDAFEASLNDRRAGRSGVATARASLKAAIAEGLTAVRTLDVIVAIALQDDPILMPVWQRARRVVGGKSELVTETGAGAPDAEPAPPVAAPAVEGDAADALEKAS